MTPGANCHRGAASPGQQLTNTSARSVIASGMHARPLPADLIVTSDDGVELALARSSCQVACVLSQCLILGLSVLVHHLGTATKLLDNLQVSTCRSVHEQYMRVST